MVFGKDEWKKLFQGSVTKSGTGEMNASRDERNAAHRETKKEYNLYLENNPEIRKYTCPRMVGRRIKGSIQDMCVSWI